MFDLSPATHEVKRLVSGVRDEQLGGPTPCAEWTVAGLLAHVHQFAVVFADNARKQPTRPPETLVDDWREEIPRQLDDLVAAWRPESAWRGRVEAGGVGMDAADNAVVAIEELIVHGWDLARATGQSIAVDDTQLDQVDRFFALFAEETPDGQGPFGPVAEAPAGASRFERILAHTGRNPSWQADA